jgi:hypothetical protein
MRRLGTLLLGIAIGVAGFFLVQHPGSIEIIGGAFGAKSSSPPQIRQNHSTAEWCAAHPQLVCK